MISHNSNWALWIQISKYFDVHKQTDNPILRHELKLIKEPLLLIFWENFVQPITRRLFLLEQLSCSGFEKLSTKPFLIYLTCTRQLWNNKWIFRQNPNLYNPSPKETLNYSTLERNPKLLLNKEKFQKIYLFFGGWSLLWVLPFRFGFLWVSATHHQNNS